MPEKSPRRLLLVCPVLAPGRSGVGDYARRLAAGLSALGRRCRLASLCEPPDCPELGVCGDGAEFRGRAGFLSRPAEREAFAVWIAQEPPEFASLQFVCYGYHPKGLPFQLGPQLRALLPSAKFHIMFHETWTGGPGAPLRRRLAGALQRHIIARLPVRFGGALCHTHALPYAEQLRAAGVGVRPLPLFSNIAPSPPWPRGRFAEWLRGRCGERLLDCGDFLAAHFGAVYPEWDPAPLFGHLDRLLVGKGRRGLVLAVGRDGPGGAALRAHFEKAGYGALKFAALGPLAEAEVSQCLHAAALGLSSTPPDLIQKSAAAAVLFAHGLPVVASRPPVFGLEMLGRVRKEVPGLVAGEEVFGNLLDLERLENVGHSVEAVAARFSADLEPL